MRVVTEHDGWRAWVPWAPAYPYQVRLAPSNGCRICRRSTAPPGTPWLLCWSTFSARVQRPFDPPMPYMFWWVQRPTDGGPWPAAWLHLELVSPWRSAGVARYVAAGELGGGVLINPVDPDDAAARLRTAG